MGLEYFDYRNRVREIGFEICRTEFGLSDCRKTRRLEKPGERNRITERGLENLEHRSQITEINRITERYRNRIGKLD